MLTCSGKREKKNKTHTNKQKHLLQVGLPPCLYGDTPISLTLRGGTNAIQAPPCEYLEYVTLPILTRMGVSCKMTVKRRGFYPKGGGEVILAVNPLPVGGCLEPIRLVGNRGVISKVTVYAYHTPQMDPAGVTEGAIRELCTRHYGTTTQAVLVLEAVTKASDHACGVTCVAESESGFLFGFTELEEKSNEPLSALVTRAFGTLAARIPSQDRFICVDEYLQDQLVIFAALAQGASAWQTGPITLHTKTAIFFCSKLSGCKFRVYLMDEKGTGKKEINVETDEVDYEGTRPNSRFLIECDGIGYKRK